MFHREIGRHTAVIEPPDVVHFIPRGDVTPDEMRAFGAFIDAHASTPYVLMLLNLAEQGAVSAESRKAAAEASRNVPARGMAAYGASFMARVVSQMIAAAMAIFTKNESPLRFFRTEAEARRWLEVRRRELSARG